jgi:hypothetical protein
VSEEPSLRFCEEPKCSTWQETVPGTFCPFLLSSASGDPIQRSRDRRRKTGPHFSPPVVRVERSGGDRYRSSSKAFCGVGVGGHRQFRGQTYAECHGRLVRHQGRPKKQKSGSDTFSCSPFRARAELNRVKKLLSYQPSVLQCN